MKISEVSFVEMLPRIFRNDRTVQGISAACDYLLQQILSSGAMLPIWTQIDKQPESVLDEMATALNLLWYDHGATVTQKRSLIKSAEKVYRQLGTPAAVKQVAQDYFGAATVEEWWEYGGDPGHFRIKIQAQSLTQDQIDAFTRNVRWVKRASAHLDSITTEELMEGVLRVGGVIHEVAVDKLTGGEQ